MPIGTNLAALSTVGIVLDFDNFLVKSDTSTGSLFEHRQKSYTFVAIHLELNFVDMKLKSGISILLSFLFVLTAKNGGFCGVSENVCSKDAQK